MLNHLKEGFSSLNLLGKLLSFFLIGMAGANLYGFFNAWHIGSYDSAYSHLIYTFTLMGITLAIFFTTAQSERARRMFNEANKLYGDGYEEKRMAMYEKLLKKKEDQIQ